MNQQSTPINLNHGPTVDKTLSELGITPEAFWELPNAQAQLDICLDAMMTPTNVADPRLAQIIKKLGGMVDNKTPWARPNNKAEHTLPKHTHQAADPAYDPIRHEFEAVCRRYNIHPEAMDDCIYRMIQNLANNSAASQTTGEIHTSFNHHTVAAAIKKYFTELDSAAADPLGSDIMRTLWASDIASKTETMSHKDREKLFGHGTVGLNQFKRDLLALSKIENYGDDYTMNLHLEAQFPNPTEYYRMLLTYCIQKIVSTGIDSYPMHNLAALYRGSITDETEKNRLHAEIFALKEQLLDLDHKNLRTRRENIDLQENQLKTEEVIRIGIPIVGAVSAVVGAAIGAGATYWAMQGTPAEQKTKSNDGDAQHKTNAHLPGKTGVNTEAFPVVHRFADSVKTKRDNQPEAKTQSR